MEPLRATKTDVKGSRRDSTDQIPVIPPPSLEHPREITPTATLPAQSGEASANGVRAAPRAAGLWNGFNSHSGRIGMARRMVAAGAPNATVQHQGRWKHGDMVARYTRGEVAGEALKWLT